VKLYLDTQVVVWLAEGRTERLTVVAASAIEEFEPVISPMVMLEIEYLFEIKRIIRPPLMLMNQLEAQIGLRQSDQAFTAVIQTALFETWTRDPFDRVIVAHARTDAMSPLVTSDEKIRENYPRSVW
jgi:PIN domain nuclease of toxin-antitoxin system